MANSNMANNRDGSFHIYLDPKPKPKSIPKVQVVKMEVKHDKKTRRE